MRRRLIPLLTLVLAASALTACNDSKGGKKLSAEAGAFSPTTGEPSQIFAKIDVGGQPCGVEVMGDDVWVTDAQNAKLIRINAETQKVTGRFSIDAKPCELMEARGALWIVTQSGVLDRVDPVDGKVHAKIKVGEGSYESLEAFGSIWVSNRNSRTLTRIDPATNKVIATIDTPEIQPGGLTSAGGSLWIGNDTEQQQFLNRYFPDTKKLETVATGMRPNFVTSAGDSVWVAARDDGTVVRVDARTGALKGNPIRAGVRPVNLDAFDGASGEVWVPDDIGNLLTRIDASTGEAIERIPMGKGPAVVKVTSTVVWVTNFEDGTVWGLLPGARG